MYFQGASLHFDLETRNPCVVFFIFLLILNKQCPRPKIFWRLLMLVILITYVKVTGGVFFYIYPYLTQVLI